LSIIYSSLSVELPSKSSRVIINHNGDIFDGDLGMVEIIADHDGIDYKDIILKGEKEYEKYALERGFTFCLLYIAS
jgi:hypothetical protein